VTAAAGSLATSSARSHIHSALSIACTMCMRRMSSVSRACSPSADAAAEGLTLVHFSAQCEICFK
jgi:hypothetical protein